MRVETHTTLPWPGASGSPPPPSFSHNLEVGGPCGAGNLGSCSRLTVSGSLGSCDGGLGMIPLSIPELLASGAPLPPTVCCLDRRVSVCFACSCSPNSQQGRTMWPDGATSSWKLSVPGGSASVIRTSPGPQKCNFNVVKSRTARLSRRAVSPNNPGKSEFATAGVLSFP